MDVLLIKIQNIYFQSNNILNNHSEKKKKNHVNCMPIFFFFFSNNQTDVPMKFAIILSRRTAAMLFPITLTEFVPILLSWTMY